MHFTLCLDGYGYLYSVTPAKGTQPLTATITLSDGLFIELAASDCHDAGLLQRLQHLAKEKGHCITVSFKAAYCCVAATYSTVGSADKPLEVLSGKLLRLRNYWIDGVRAKNNVLYLAVA